MKSNLDKLEQVSKKLDEPSEILLIDDNLSILDILDRICEEEGFKVYKAVNVDIALALVASHDIDLVFLDMMLPGKDGFDFLNEIRKKKRIPPVCVISGWFDDKYLNSLATVFPVVTWVTKPFDPSKIREVLSAFNLNSGKP